MHTPLYPRPTLLRTGATLWTGLVVLLCGMQSAAQTTPAADSQRNSAQMMLFHQHPEDFKGGRQLAVTVYISAFTWNGLSAMGLYETVPDGWTYAGARAVAGTMPSVTPKNGDSGVLQFLWVEQSTAPITFQYLLDIPPRESGTRVLSGQVEYRLGEGAQTSNVAFSQVTGVADALPVVTLRGSAEITISLNTGFRDPGATASDAEDGDLSNKIETAGSVDTGEPGSYTLTYGVTDSVGNASVPVSRQVTVRDSPADSGGGNPDGEKPDSGGGIGGTGGLELLPSPAIPQKPTEVARSFPPIKIPDISQHKVGEQFEVPMKRDESTASETGEASAEGGTAAAGESLSMADDAAASALPGRPNRPSEHGEDTDSRESATGAETSRGGLVLLAVGTVAIGSVIVLWRQSNKAVRRIPPPRQ